MDTHKNIGIVRRDAGDHASAERHLVRTLEAGTQMRDEDAIADALGLLADLATRTGDLERAESFYERFLASRRSANDLPNVIAGLRALADVIDQQGRSDEANGLRNQADEVESDPANAGAETRR